jgi:hypothetical protein
VTEIAAVPAGKKRQWVKCKTCDRVFYYDYTPYGLSNPYMESACGHAHGFGRDFLATVKLLAADDAAAHFAGGGK